ncbi:MAG: PTS transporter subunit EIIC [Eubacteriaceae bacterium]|jgi:PTS system beta-glucosides-specific IIC component
MEKRIFEFISAVFTPILPAIIGAGLIKSFLALAVLLGMDSEGTVYYFINLIGDAPLYFLPVMLAYTGAKKLGCNQYIAVGIAGAMLHPNYTALVTDAYSLHFTSFLGIPVTLASYSCGVIPSLLMVIALFYTEKLLDRIIPKMLQFFFKPVISLMFVGMLSFIVLGPIGFIIGTGISTGLDALNQVAGWAVPTIVGCIFPLMVTTGMHYGFVPFMIQSLGAQGFETLCGPGNLPSNIAQGAASLAIAFKTKNLKMKETAFTTGTTALLGITEPALYSVTLKSKKTLASVMIGGGLGGFYAGITGVKCFSFCSPGLLSLVAFIGSDGWSNLINACISMAISFVVTFAVTWFWGFEEADEIKKADGAVLTKTGEAEPVVQAAE